MGNTCAKTQQPPPTNSKPLLNQPMRTVYRQPPLLANIAEAAPAAVTDPVSIKSISIYQDYIFIYPRLGKGSFGDVYKCVHKKSGIIRAVKQIFGKRSDRIRDLSEFDILKKLDHPNIVRIYETYIDDRDVFIVMQLCTGGELFDYIVQEKRLSESIAAGYVSQILSALAHCHANHIVHRDLKPSNIMLSRKESHPVLKIIDFGASQLVRSTIQSFKRIGTTYYAAPEMFEGNGEAPCDIWSCGVIMYIMLTGEPPFNGRNDHEIIDKIQNSELEFKHRLWAMISKQARELLKKMLEKDPAKRITAKDALKDPWLASKQRISLDEKQLTEAVQNMGGFRKVSHFQESIMMFIVTNLITEDDKKDIIQQFRGLDANGDGRISKQQLKETCNRIEKFRHVTDGEIEQIFMEVDRDMSGYIDYSGTFSFNEEFVTASIRKAMLIKRRHLQRTFDLIDKDHNGRLSLKELQVFLGGAITKEVYESIIRQCGGDPQQEITRDMFINMMIKAADGTAE